jgi:hypothetical protein
MARAQDKTYDTDRLETASPVAARIADATSNFAADSPTAARDAGLDDELLEEDGDDLDLLLEEDLNEADGEFEEDNPRSFVEIPMSDLASAPSSLGSPEMSDLNVPGEVDIEELDEHALDNTTLPADARLDPLEE